MSPQQEIYNAVFKVCLDLGYSTYDYLPATQVTLPFVYVGEQFDQDQATKTVIYGNVQQTIHLYGDYKRRATLTTMMDNIKREIRKLKHTNHFYLAVRNLDSQTMIDTTAEQPLLHGIIEIEFRFN